MKEIFLLKEGEIVLKGLNKRTFEDAFIRNLKHRLNPLGEYKVTKAQSTIYVELGDEVDADEAFSRCCKVFGVAAVCRAAVCEKNMESIAETAISYLEDTLLFKRTFKVEARRSDKRFPLKSPEICADIGEILLDKFPNLIVDVKNPDVVVTVEVRDTNAYVHAVRVPGAGGMPVGTSGKAMLMLSGGIDSPVAAYMMAKRGISVETIHFAAPPYTSERARLKVERLCEKLTPYCGDLKFICVPFTEIQVALRDNCPEELFTIIMRRLMMEIAQRIAEKDGCQALITGESVGQVASQTMGAIVCTDAACRMPVYRPVIGMDKSEIVEIARKIDTFETSIEPYEDCCTVFTPKHPKTKPNLAEVVKAQESFDFEPLIAAAVENVDVKVIKL